MLKLLEKFGVLEITEVLLVLEKPIKTYQEGEVVYT